MTDRPIARSIDDQIAEVGREIGLRKNVYPGLVARGKMEQPEADEHLARMTAAYATLQWVRRHREVILQVAEQEKAPAP